MQASCYQLVAVCQLYHLTEVHNADTVGDMFYDGEVMGDEQISQSHLLLQLLEHIHHLCPDRYIQCGDRLIADDELRVHCQCSRNADTLTLSTGEFMRISVRMLGVQSYSLQHGDDPVMTFLLIGSQLMDVDGFPYDISYGHSGIQTCIRILEYHLHLLTVRQHIYLYFIFNIQDHIAVKCDLTTGGLI